MGKETMFTISLDGRGALVYRRDPGNRRGHYGGPGPGGGNRPDHRPVRS